MAAAALWSGSICDLQAGRSSGRVDPSTHTLVQIGSILDVIKHYFIDQKARGARGVVHNLELPAIGLALAVCL
ncbi:UNVERIFIED_ORG: hypothetical protein J3D58_004113 [Paenarthrobacter nicotinovorans]